MIKLEITANDAADLAQQVSGLSAVMGGVAAPTTKKQADKPQAGAAATSTVSNATTVTVEMVRAIAAEKSKANATEVKAAIAEFGAKKLSELKEADYKAFYDKVNAI